MLYIKAPLRAKHCRSLFAGGVTDRRWYVWTSDHACIASSCDTYVTRTYAINAMIACRYRTEGPVGDADDDVALIWAVVR